ncbi:hypothetical protein [Cellulomonas dongxiuzhuiae]|uniref:Uncharacterized protein n=1 Tax=Cellulomonas dongxiuzhuiae TaxID=2819979 RepID=A0ABX8GJ20_9CELL|nr:hypothetical protein [Cellulomonas dongxiuzhuiae]MBO3094875.1 hypothetical protein [Cellulomonas dongxiuzhuiae]QWC15905.1 hypothetical protein KKR89_16885 [Cellulomonas dongxiuzhuiae]
MSARFGSEGFGAWVLDRLGPAARAPRRGGEPPEVDVVTGPTVSALTLRAALALVGVAAVVVAATMPGRVVPLEVLVAMVAVGVLPAVLPRWPVAAVVVLVVGVRVLVADPASPLVLAALVLLVHALLRLAAVAARTGWRTRVELAVLADDLRAALVVQGAAQVLALLAGAVAAGADGGAWRFAGLAAVVGLSVLALARPARPWWRARPDRLG